MKGERRSRAFWVGCVLVFLLALLPRVVYPVSRPLQWHERSVLFWDALLEGDLGGTYQQYHPGVTTMWIAGLGLRVYAAAHNWLGDESLNPSRVSPNVGPYPVEAGVAALGVAISLCICVAYVLLARQVSWEVGLVGGCLLALDPFCLEQSKILHVDALLATLMLVSALFLVSYLQRRRWLSLILSGVFAGLALLTKSPSGFLIPYAVLAIAYRHLADGRDPARSSKTRGWVGRVVRIARDLGVWGLTAGCIFVLLWPAMWIRPGEVVHKMMRRTEFHIETVHRNPSFFAGQVIYDDPGPLFYLATIAWKTTLVTLLTLFAAFLFLLWRARRWRDDQPVWWVLMYACGFTGAMMFAARKELRYLLPTFPALDVLAAWGLVRAASAVGRLNRLQTRTWVPATVVAAALVIQAVTVLRHHPYYGTHHNLLLGGLRVAQHVLPLGDGGEGVDLAGRFLNGYPGAERRIAGVPQRFDELLEYTFVGSSEGIEQPDVDYYVFPINSIQRQNRIEFWGEAWEASQEEEPLWSISFDGVPYVWIYPAYPSNPAAFAIDRRLEVPLGDHVHLLGYSLGSSDISAGDTLTVTLFWQSDGRLVEDYHVFVHLQGVGGQVATQHDGVPARGERPTWDWCDKEVIRDEHVLVSDAGLPAGTYTLSIGMYDYLTQARLPAVGPDGERLPEDRVVLQDIQVTPP
jgi:hypothetical protein